MQHRSRYSYLSGADLVAEDATARRFLSASPLTPVDRKPASLDSSQIDEFLSRAATREAGPNAIDGRALRAAFMRAYMRMAARDRLSDG